MAGVDKRLRAAVITGVHGVRGIVRVKSFTEMPEAIADYGPLEGSDGRSYEVEVTGSAKGVLLCRLSGVADRNAAEALKGVELFLSRGLLPADEDEDEWYAADLIGLEAVFPTGEPAGTVLAVHDFGAGDLLEIACPDGAVELLPFAEAFVPEVSLDERRIVIDPPAGLFGIPTEDDLEAEDD